MRSNNLYNILGKGYKVKNWQRMGLIAFSLLSFTCTGCELLLKILQKEIAEERELLGDRDIHTYNPNVERLQRILKELGYNPGPIDGRLGYRTRKAIKMFQKDRGLKPSGYLDKVTWYNLQAVYKKIKFSSQIISVKQIQSALKKAGFDLGPIDGKMGPRTKKAIKEFQKAKGLTPNGIVGYKTWEELRKYIE